MQLPIYNYQAQRWTHVDPDTDALLAGGGEVRLYLSPEGVEYEVHKTLVDGEGQPMYRNR